MARLAMVDNYDSFTYNLVQYMAELGAEPAVFRNDEVSVDELAKFDGIVISPGPGTPDDAGISNEAVRALSGKVAILGVCLGHQCIGQVFGGEVVRNEPSHGKTSWIHHDNSGVLAGVSEPFEATRYHSLIVKRSSVPPELVVTAWTARSRSWACAWVINASGRSSAERWSATNRRTARRHGSTTTTRACWPA